MEIQSAMLADAARTTSDGKLYIFGGQWDRIWAQTFPAPHPSMAVVLVVRVEYSEALEDHSLVLFLEKDGEPVGPRADAEFNVGHAPFTKPGAPSFFPLALTFNSVRFDGPGRYEWVARIDNLDVARLPLELSLKLPS